MANPLDNNELTFYLDFKNNESFGEIPITEVVKFDGATYIVEQDTERYGRDVAFMNESIDLFFYKGFYNTTENALMLPDGTIVFNLTMGFEQLMESRKVDGFESDIIFGSRKNGVDFIFGNLDFELSETDEQTFISCKVIQNVDKQIIKRGNELTVDVFSDEDINGETITPLTTIPFLQKAKPINQISKWNTRDSESVQIGIGEMYFNYIKNVELTGIDDSLSFFDSVIYNDSSGVSNFKFLKAQTSLTNIKLDINNIDYHIDLQAPQFIFIDFSIYYSIGDTFDYNNKVLIHNEYKPLIGVPNTHNFIYSGITDVPFISSGQFLWVWFEFDTGVNNPLTSSDNLVSFDNSGTLDINATSTAIDTVVQGVRYIDLFKQCVKSISGFYVIAPRFDVGGEFYDQFAFSGNLIKNRTDLPFNTDFKYLVQTLKEVNADYQIIDGSVYIGLYKDFYTNNEIGALLSYPDESSRLKFNSRFALNQLEYKYANFEQDDDEANTIDSVHTYSQWSFPNKQVEKAKKLDFKHIRDPFKIEKIRKEAIKTTTATANDDKTILIDVVTLAPNSKGGFTIPLSHNVNSDGNLQLLNDNSFSWAVLGIGVGGFLDIINTGNIGNREILEITDNIITVSGGVANGQNVLTEIEYFYTNVLFTNRTNQGFDVINNLDNPQSFSNLRYTIKRNLKQWYSYFATVSKFAVNGVFRNTEFTNNGALETKYTGETELTIEKANVNVIDFGTPILSANLYEYKLVVDYDTMVNVLNALNTVNTDGTIGGFIRTIRNDGSVLNLYPQKLEYEPATETLTLTGEEKYKNPQVLITSLGSSISIDGVSYSINTSEEWYQINNEFLIVFDSNNLPIISPTLFSLVAVNGVFSSTEIELSQKLIVL